MIFVVIALIELAIKSFFSSVSNFIFIDLKEFIFVDLKVPIIALISLFLIFKIYEYIYYNSKKFKEIKESIQAHIDNSNELNHHIEELKSSYVNIKSYDYGKATIVDSSVYNFKRIKWSKNLKNKFFHNCSATVCKNASAQPFKYFCKYFNVNINEESLLNFEKVLNNFAAAEQGKEFEIKERNSILNRIKNSIPWLINVFSKKKLIKKLGFEEVDLSDLYFPIYTFQYVSAGGNSSMKCDIKFDIENLDKFIFYLSDLIKFRKSIKGQRALMTSNLRKKIKARDNYTCQICNLSINDEKNLLLEIDHIIPLSKGGLTTEKNLQTLCWKCNRSKGAKML